ncbi:MAG: DUF4291 domain-containing protein [Myxococcales bacterium]|nr:DUF4291 domain-containing protein [Myxococcales bacterium]
MTLRFEPHAEQEPRWPPSGRHVLAQYDDESVVVYQAYRPETARFAVEHQRFGGPTFSFGRMSWVKPNFLWMMFRSGWGTKEGQEVTLAVRLRRSGFDAILAAAVPSSPTDAFPDSSAWKAAVRGSEVRLQWDPDHDPHGRPLVRRAIQLGLRGEMLRRYATEWIVGVENVSAFVAEQRSLRGTAALSTPFEQVYPIVDPEVARRVQVTPLASDDRNG